MVKARLNPLFAAISGKIEEIVGVERQGNFFVRKLRTRTTQRRRSPKELGRGERENSAKSVISTPFIAC